MHGGLVLFGLPEAAVRLHCPVSLELRFDAPVTPLVGKVLGTLLASSTACAPSSPVKDQPCNCFVQLSHT